MKQRILAILLSLTMIFTLVPTAMAADGENTISSDATWESGRTLNHDLTISDGVTLTVKGSITVQGSVTISGGGTIVADTTGTFAVAGENNAEEGIDAGIATVLIASDDSNVTLSGVTIDAKSADGDTSLRVAVVNRGATLTLSDGAVITGGNASAVASENPPQYNSFGGGGVFVCDGGNLLLKGGSIKKNKGFQGGGVYVYGEGILTIESGAISENNGTNNGGGVWLYSNSADKHPTLTMTGGQISKNTTAGGGGGVCVHSQSIMYMSGGGISENKTTGNTPGGGIFLQGQKFEMTGGSIYKNSSNRSGGGVHINGSKSTFIMNGGEISENTAQGGAGVNVQNGQFTMNDNAHIEKNSATSNGGGVRVYMGAFVMNGGTISENHAKLGGGIDRSHDASAGTGGSVAIHGGNISKNEATEAGGGIYSQGKFSMDAGSITENTATQSGGGIHIYCGAAAISGGMITNNSVVGTNALGGGVYVNNSAIPTENHAATKLTLSGSPKIIGNTRANAASNIYVYQGELYQTAALTDAAKIGVSKVNHDGAVVGAEGDYTLAENDLAAYSYDDDAHTVDLDSTNNQIKIVSAAIITFHANYSGSTETATQKVVQGKQTMLRPNTFKNPGMTFVEWNTAEDGTGDSYSADVAQTFLNNKALYAKWRDRALSSIEVTANKMSFAYGTVLSTDDFTVMAVYDNGETAEATTGFIIDPSTALMTPGTVQVTVTYQGKTQTCGITVDKASQAAPISAPTLKGRTYTSITLNTVEPNANGAAAQYSKDGGKTWQDSAEFTELTSNTTYTFAVRYAEKAPYAASAASDTAEFSTLYRSSGSSSDPTYSVSTPSKTENGTVTVSPKSASKGDTVTITVKPDSGYVLDDLTVTDKNGNELTLKDKGNGKYTFVMPAGKVEVKATFAKEIEVSPFADVATDDYYYEAVKWAVKNGITTGVGNNLFAPGQPCTRAQIVTFLWRAAGSPAPKNMSSFADVPADAFYAKAVAWAVENGITGGTGDGKFSPDATCTRAQAVTFLARALSAKASGKAEFSDVPADSYFADAVAWAAANGVTEGIGGGLFAPDNDCTRGQIVSFLFRAYNK